MVSVDAFVLSTDVADVPDTLVDVCMGFIDVLVTVMEVSGFSSVI